LRTAIKHDNDFQKHFSQIIPDLEGKGWTINLDHMYKFTYDYERLLAYFNHLHQFNLGFGPPTNYEGYQLRCFLVRDALSGPAIHLGRRVPHSGDTEGPVPSVDVAGGPDFFTRSGA